MVSMHLRYICKATLIVSLAQNKYLQKSCFGHKETQVRLQNMFFEQKSTEYVSFLLVQVDILLHKSNIC